MQANFPASWRSIVGAQAKLAIEEKIKRQHHRHEKAIIQVSVKKGGIVVEVGFDQLAVNEVGREAHHENRVMPVTESTVSFKKHKESQCLSLEVP